MHSNITAHISVAKMIPDIGYGSREGPYRLCNISAFEKWTVFSFKIFVYDFVTSPDNESSSRLSGVIEALS